MDDDWQADYDWLQRKIPPDPRCWRVKDTAVPSANIPSVTRPFVLKQCCIRGCKVRNDTLVFPFPPVKHPKYIAWLEACSQNGEVPRPGNFTETFVCAKHFVPEEDYTDFTETDLKDDAVPSLDLNPGYSRVCCLPKCSNLPRVNPLKPVVLFSWPTCPEMSDVWFNSLEGIVTKEGLDTKKAKVCSRHFDPSEISTDVSSVSSVHSVATRVKSVEISAKLSLSKKAVPWVDPAKVSVVTAEPSVTCSVVNCRGSGAAAFRVPKVDSLLKIWIGLAWNVGNTVIEANDYVCSRHFDDDCFVEYPNKLHPTACPEVYNVCASSLCPSNWIHFSGSVGKRVSYFHFPKSKKIQDTWLVRMRIMQTSLDTKQGMNMKAMRLCHAHFSNSDIQDMDNGSLSLKENCNPIYLLPDAPNTDGISFVPASLAINDQDSEVTKLLKQSAANSQLVRIPLGIPQATSEQQSYEDSEESPIIETSSVCTQADDLIDMTTMAFLKRLEYLIETDSDLDRQIEQLEKHKETLMKQPAKLLLVHPILLQDSLEGSPQDEIATSEPDPATQESSNSKCFSEP